MKHGNSKGANRKNTNKTVQEPVCNEIIQLNLSMSVISGFGMAILCEGCDLVKWE